MPRPSVRPSAALAAALDRQDAVAARGGLPGGKSITVPAVVLAAV